MRFSFFKNKQQKEKFFLSLDIGTEAIKAVIFQEKNSKIAILADSLQYFEKYGIFNGRNFEMDIIKRAIVKSIDELYKDLSFSLIKKELKNKIKKQKRWQVLLGISADKLKARIVFQNFLRENPHQKISKEEEKIIFQEVVKQAQQKIFQKFSKEFGILPIDIHLNSIKVIGIKIDGYNVPTLYGYEGKNLQFKILITFLLKYYLENIKRIFGSLEIEILKIIHPAEHLSILYKNERRNGVFIDVGGSITQIFLVENNDLEQIDEFEGGGKNFSEILSQNLGIDEETARILKEKYSNRLLSIEAAQKIKKIFGSEQRNWYLNLKNKIEKIKRKELFTSNIYLFGGGSLLPEIKEVLEEEITSDLRDSTVSDNPEIKLIYPKNFKNIENLTVGLKNPQNTPILLICSYVNAKEIF